MLALILLMATYFLSATGNDSNNGLTSGAPWLTLSHASAQTYSAGDSLSLKGGDSFTGTLTIGNSGSVGNPITIGSYGTGKATISCGHDRGVYLQNCAYVTVQDLIVTGVGVVSATGAMSDADTSKRYGIDVESTLSVGTLSTIKILRCVVSSCWGGILVHCDAATTPVGFTDVEIGGSTSDPLIVHACANIGIWTYGSLAANSTGSPYFLAKGREHSAIHVHHFQVYDIYGFDSNTIYDGTINFQGSGVVLQNCTGATYGDNLIELGVCHDCGKNSADNASRGGPVNVWTLESDYVTIQDVESYNAKSAGSDGSGFDIDGGAQHTIIQRCYSHHNKRNGFIIGSFSGNSAKPNDATFRFNISEKNPAGALTTFNQFGSNVVIERNTFYEEGLVSSSSLAVIVCPSSNVTWTIRNNILITNDAGNFLNLYVYGSPDTSVATVQGNLYWSTASTPRWRTVNGGGAGTFSTLANFRASVTASPPEMSGVTAVGSLQDPALSSVGNGGTIGSAGGPNTALTAYDPASGGVANSAGISGGTSVNDFHGNAPTTGLAVGAAEYTAVVRRLFYFKR